MHPPSTAFAAPPPPRLSRGRGSRSGSSNRASTSCSRAPPPRIHATGPSPAGHPRRAFLLGLIATTGAYLLHPEASRAEQFAKVVKTPEEWRASLTPNQFRVLREEATESMFSSPLNSEARAGVFNCAGCGNPLFSSETKFDSGTGWPSFFDSLPDGVELRKQTRTDKMLFRTEVHCKKCDGHIGHVFPDGPRPTGKRYCMNGLALAFEPNQ